MIRSLLIVMLLLVGCADGMHIERHHVSQKKIDKLNPIEGRPGFAIWNFSINECDIFILHKSEFGIFEDEYHEVLGHETRHCFEGDWHPE